MTNYRVQDHRRFAAGALMCFIGLVAGYEALSLEAGEMSRMGPGYLPRFFSAALIVVGLMTSIGSLASPPVIEPDAEGRFALGPVLAVTAATMAFGFLIERAGLAAAVMAAVLIVSYGRLRENPIESVILAVAVTAFTIVLFVYLLGLPFKVF